MKLTEVITFGFTTDDGASGVFSCAIDTSPTAPTPYRQVKAAMRTAGWAAEPPDDPEFETAINARFSAGTDGDLLAASTAQVAAVLTQIAARQSQIEAERTAVTSDLTALAATTTLAQVRPIVGRMLAREDNALTAEKRILEMLDRVLRALRRLL